MRFPSAAALLLAVTVAACSDSRTPTSPASRPEFVPTVQTDLVSTGSEINSLIDQIYSSPVIRNYAHAAWNYIVAQLATCPPSQTTLQLQTYLNQLVSFLQANTPRGNSAKQALVSKLITDMSSYVNEAIAACPAT